jgi:hypothetical protein
MTREVNRVIASDIAPGNINVADFMLMTSQITK